MSLVALLLSTALAQADVPLPPPPPPPAPSVAAGPSEGAPRLGLAFQAGFPEGVALGLLYRPLPSLRLWAGPAWNYASLGIQGGAAFHPWRLAVSPFLSVEAGRYFSSDMSFAAQGSSGVPEELAPLLDDVRYAYGAAHLGLEVGSPNGLAFSLSVGLAYVSVEARGTASSTADGGGTTAEVEFDDPKLRGTLPSVKLGLHYWF